MTLIEWDRREVCPNGACIGVIGDDGLCKVCGRAAPNWGSERTRGLVDPPSDDVEAAGDAGDDDDEADDDLEAAADDTSGAESGDEWDNRELCSNGACVGVIDDNGICSVCGSPRA